MDAVRVTPRWLMILDDVACTVVSVMLIIALFPFLLAGAFLWALGSLVLWFVRRLV